MERPDVKTRIGGNGLAQPRSRRPIRKLVYVVNVSLDRCVESGPYFPPRTRLRGLGLTQTRRFASALLLLSYRVA
jgi:hypothetical protein